MDYRELVRGHYKKEADECGASLLSTMRDKNTRRLEIKHLVSYLEDGQRCLEVGCGNGAASIEISKARKLDLLCFDFSTDLIRIANQQPREGVKGVIRFHEGDVLNSEIWDELSAKGEPASGWDVVFTERVIINLLEWEHQKQALENMAKTLRSGGKLILLEAFKDGLEKLNRFRNLFGLGPIPVAYHNLHLEKDKTIEYLESHGMKLKEENNFLSTYYFGSRVLYPFFMRLLGKKPKYNSFFVRPFALLPSFGNHAHIKILVFEKPIR